MSGKWEHAVAIFDRMKRSEDARPDQRSYACIISACGKGENWEMAVSYLQDMLNSGIP